ncbi:DUF6326 family protein [Roseateles sp. LYH14W]|uniref:DUF6326 family protein n=1 Tax=Pelomonas parva TaxID=3299032 RepID=A0ABW7F4K9_9BURK
MKAIDTTAAVLQDTRVDIKAQLSALWVTAMFCYIYADILGLYDKWLLGEILKGNMGPLGPITQGLKLGVAVLMSVPALMVLASLTLNARANRWANMVSGSLMTVVILLTLVMAFVTQAWAYYVYFAVIEVSLTTFIAYRAWAWPRSGP